MDTKKRPHSLSTHHLIGCKDSDSTQYSQTFYSKITSGRYSRHSRSGVFDFHCPLGLKVSGWNPICVLETTFF